MKTKTSSILLAAFGVVSLAVALPLTMASAQQAGRAAQVNPPQVRERIGEPAIVTAPQAGFRDYAVAPPVAQPGFVPQGGQPVMIQDDNYLYILRGDRVCRVTKSSLSDNREYVLPGPRRGVPASGVMPAQPGDRPGGGEQTPEPEVAK